MSITFKIYWGRDTARLSVAMTSGEILTGAYTLNREQNIIPKLPSAHFYPDCSPWRRSERGNQRG